MTEMIDMEKIEAKVDAWFNENKSNNPIAQMLWVDIETTGLNPSTGSILEIGMMVTDKFGFPVANGLRSWLIDQSGNSKDYDNFIVSMHTKNRLFEELENDTTVEIEQAAWEIESFIYQHFQERKPCFCGSSVGFDKQWILHYMPNIETLINYRIIDISTIKELVALHWPNERKAELKPMRTHRVIPDLIDTITEYRHYLYNYLWTEENGNGIYRDENMRLVVSID